MEKGGAALWEEAGHCNEKSLQLDTLATEMGGESLG